MPLCIYLWYVTLSQQPNVAGGEGEHSSWGYREGTVSVFSLWPPWIATLTLLFLHAEIPADSCCVCAAKDWTRWLWPGKDEYMYMHPLTPHNKWYASLLTGKNSRLTWFQQSSLICIKSSKWQALKMKRQLFQHIIYVEILVAVSSCLQENSFYHFHIIYDCVYE